MAKANDTFSTLHQALEFRNNEHLHKLLALLPTKETATRKANLVGLIAREMEGDNLRRLYEQLDEMQQKAVSEAVWDKEGYFRADRFKAKYERWNARLRHHKGRAYVQRLLGQPDTAGADGLHNPPLDHFVCDLAGCPRADGAFRLRWVLTRHGQSVDLCRRKGRGRPCA